MTKPTINEQLRKLEAAEAALESLAKMTGAERHRMTKDAPTPNGQSPGADLYARAHAAMDRAIAQAKADVEDPRVDPLTKLTARLVGISSAVAKGKLDVDKSGRNLTPFEVLLLRAITGIGDSIWHFESQVAGYGFIGEDDED